MHVEKPKVYFKLGDYDDNIIDELYVGPGFRAKIVKWVKTGSGDTWAHYWYLVELPNGARAWMNPGILMQIREP